MNFDIRSVGRALNPVNLVGEAQKVTQKAAQKVVQGADVVLHKGADVVRGAGSKVGSRVKDQYQGLKDQHRANEVKADKAKSWIGEKVSQAQEMVFDKPRRDLDKIGKQGGFLGTVAKVASFGAGVEEGLFLGAKDAVAGTFSLAEGAAKVASPVEWVLNPEGNLGRIKATGEVAAALAPLTNPVTLVAGLGTGDTQKTVGALWNGITEPYRQGDVAQGVGRGIFDIGSLFVGGEISAGAKGAGAASKTTKGLSGLENAVPRLKGEDGLPQTLRRFLGEDKARPNAGQPAAGKQSPDDAEAAGVPSQAADDAKTGAAAKGEAPISPEVVEQFIDDVEDYLRGVAQDKVPALVGAKKPVIVNSADRPSVTPLTGAAERTPGSAGRTEGTGRGSNTDPTTRPGGTAGAGSKNQDLAPPPPDPIDASSSPGRVNSRKSAGDGIPIAHNAKEAYATIRQEWGHPMTEREMRELNDAVVRAGNGDTRAPHGKDGTPYDNAPHLFDPDHRTSEQNVKTVGRYPKTLNAAGGYQEYTVNTPNVGGRAERRIVINYNEKKAYYSHDHYEHFIDISKWVFGEQSHSH